MVSGRKSEWKVSYLKLLPKFYIKTSRKARKHTGKTGPENKHRWRGFKGSVIMNQYYRTMGLKR